MKLKPHQILSSNQITAALEEQNKVLFCGACAIGKTVIVLSLVKKWVQEGKRVAISTYSKSDIRNHWLTELKDKFSSLFPNTQVITSVNDLKLQWKKGNPAVSSKRASKTIPLTIFIPQSVRGNLGKFDIIVVDEAHEYLDVKNSKGTLKDIIRKHRHSKTKILGLSATGFDLIKKGMYFEKSKKVIYDVPTALYQNIITNCTAAIRHFDILFSKKHFNSIGDLNSRGIRFWANQFGVKKILLLEKLETVLKELKGKTLIIVPGGIDPKTNMGKETEVCQFLNETFGKGKKVAIAKSSRYSLEEQEKNENEFRTNPRIKFMIVIGMCGTGWDYPGLTNVVDLTFTSNPKLIIHRMSRTTRKFPGKQKGFYVYCADQSKKDGKSVYYLTRALELMTEKGIRD
jgi:superfamily II DNA or RNA helicase